MRQNNAKYVIVFALLISVAALSIGFAAYSNTLTIKASADVSGCDTCFNVSLSKSSSSVTTGAVTPTTSGTAGATGAIATLSANKIEGLKATFTAKGQTVKYSFYAYNAGEFLAYLNSVAIGSKTCTAGTGTTNSYVQSACNGISISVKVNTTTYTSTNNAIGSHTLATGAAEPIEVSITYASDAAVADGDFTVSFGDVVLTYGSAD